MTKHRIHDTNRHHSKLATTHFTSRTANYEPQLQKQRHSIVAHWPIPNEVSRKEWERRSRLSGGF